MHTISKTFLDTNVFVALRDEEDLTHSKAIILYDLVKSQKIKLYTSSDIIAETLTVMSKKVDKKSALEFLDWIEGRIGEIFIDENLHKETRKFFKSVKSKNISFIDCSSVVAMKRNKIKYIFSFDEDFKKMGVELLSDAV